MVALLTAVITICLHRLPYRVQATTQLAVDARGSQNHPTMRHGLHEMSQCQLVDAAGLAWRFDGRCARLLSTLMRSVANAH